MLRQKRGEGEREGRKGRGKKEEKDTHYPHALPREQ